MRARNVGPHWHWFLRRRSFVCSLVRLWPKPRQNDVAVGHDTCNACGNATVARLCTLPAPQPPMATRSTGTLSDLAPLAPSVGECGAGNLRPSCVDSIRCAGWPLFGRGSIPTAVSNLRSLARSCRVAVTQVLRKRNANADNVIFDVEGPNV